jgi:hypothetical protein
MCFNVKNVKMINKAIIAKKLQSYETIVYQAAVNYFSAPQNDKTNKMAFWVWNLFKLFK